MHSVAESKALLTQVENLVNIGCDLLVCKEGVDDEARQALSKHGILTYRRVEKKDHRPTYLVPVEQT